MIGLITSVSNAENQQNGNAMKLRRNKMCEYCENIFDSFGDYNPATGRFEKIKTTKPVQCYAGDIHNDALKTIWISIYPNVNKYILWCRPFDSNPIRCEENKIKVEINYCPMCGRNLKEEK